MYGLLKPPVAMIAPTATTSSTIVRRPRRRSSSVWTCWLLTSPPYATTASDATRNRVLEAWFITPNSTPARIVTARLPTVRSASRLSRRDPAPALDGAAARRPNRFPAAFGLATVELV